MLSAKRKSKIVSFIAAIAVFVCGFITVYAQELEVSKSNTEIYIDSGTTNVIMLEQQEESQDEKVLYTANDSDTRTVIGETTQLFVNLSNFNWNISSECSSKSGGMYLTKGAVVTIAAVWEDASCDIKIGITDGKTFYFYNASGGSYLGNIVVPTSGTYSVQVKNISSKGITIAGNYSTN